MQGPASEENLFFFDNGCRFPHLKKYERIPTDKLPEALREFRLTTGSNSENAASQKLKNKDNKKDKNKQNVNFNEEGGGVDNVNKKSNRKKRKRLKTFESEYSFEIDIEDDGKFLFEEAKYSSTAILEQLGKVLHNIWERTVYQNNWNKFLDEGSGLKFERDINGFKWRFEISDKLNKKAFYLPEYLLRLIDVEYSEFCRSVQYRQREWQTQAYKDVTDFSTGALKRLDSGIFSVPPTRMSVTTIGTMDGDRRGGDSNAGKSKVLQEKSSYDSGMTHASDQPSIVAYRRESRTPVYFVPKPNLRHNAKVSLAKGVRPGGRNSRMENVEVKLGVLKAFKDDGEEDYPYQFGPHSTTKFALSSKDCHEKGWIVLDSSFTEHEEKAILAYIRKILGESIVQRQEEEIANSRIFVNPEVLIHYYGDAKKKAASIYLGSERKSRKQKRTGNGVPFMVTLRDGSFAIYYPSGKICALNSFSPGNSRSSYILVYDDNTDDSSTILAHFAPAGNGVCYHKNGKIAFISTPKYACCHDELGAIINKWKWTGRKLTPGYTLKLSPHLTFRCSNKDSMAMFVNIDGESTKINLAMSEGEQKTRSQSIHGDKTKRKKGKGKGKEVEKIEEAVSNLNLGNSLTNIANYEEELTALHEKFKDTVSRWMDHYRIAVGLKPPGINRRLTCKSATVTSSNKTPVARNISTAPSGSRDFKDDMYQYSGESLYDDDSAICMKRQPFRCGVLQSPCSNLPKKGCPVVYRMELMGMTDTHCRCDRKKIPIITDIEYDSFISSLPKHQLVVISIFRERYPNAFDCTINEIYYELNKDRSFPCVQSSCDPFRMFRYPIPSKVAAAKDSLLMKRHKVVPGMFLMYFAGKLLFSDHIFDGYGYSKRDFLNQMARTQKEALEDKYLPDDYRFVPRSPSPLGIQEYESLETVDAYYSNSKSTITSTETLEEADMKRDLSIEKFPNKQRTSFLIDNKQRPSVFVDNGKNKNEVKFLS